jgi:hypothetical protein
VERTDGLSRYDRFSASEETETRQRPVTFLAQGCAKNKKNANAKFKSDASLRPPEQQ